ncbi:hypothetical protein MPL1032_30019 [Mesorhizobium plurifarium]|uniref:Uncharacterized protein n=1 Tax=Mesorhizobium plurifarium TaxID=69974 RepID=A0A0K2W330_MESPL|nr:hypothetical protein MPL1032_30019 [Mesorhizobium plurifarium]
MQKMEVGLESEALLQLGQSNGPFPTSRSSLAMIDLASQEQLLSYNMPSRPAVTYYAMCLASGVQA